MQDYNSNTTKQSIAQENYRLRQDLNRLWKDNHLTKSHEIVIAHCDGGEDCESHYPFDHMTCCVTKNAERRKITKKLTAAMQDIFHRYEFDNLVASLCQCRSCGNVLFERTLHGVIVDEITEEDGSMSQNATFGYRGPVPVN